MSHSLATAHRLIDRESMLRSDGTEPLIQSVERTIDFVANADSFQMSRCADT